MKPKHKEYLKNEITEYILAQARALLAIDSPTGYTKAAADYVSAELTSLGYSPQKTVKGGILTEIKGKSDKEALLFEAHIDTLGGMVSEIKSSGNLRISPLGGMNAYNGEAENCRIHTRDDKVYQGTLQLENASIHVNGEYNKTSREFPNMEIVVDELTHSAEDTKALGIMVGDIVAFDPRTTITESGFIKSRFLDDKLSVAILLGYARFLKEKQIRPDRKMYLYITVFEEVGHGGSASIPNDVTEVIAVDMGCIGKGLDCDETMVSICAKDSRGPYHYDVVSGLIQAAQQEEIKFAVDVYPYYGSDADAALEAGHDIRHGLIGPGVYASHGYERSHVEGVRQTVLLMEAYRQK